jgi:predicted nucleotidyltransferase
VDESWPESARRQVTGLQAGIQTIIPDKLVGIYLHGSLALGCFNPRHSDLDLLVVIQRGLTVAEKRQAIALLLQQSKTPHPVEISFLRRSDLRPWRYPTPFDLHYGEDWRDRFTQDLASGAWHRWNARGQPRRYDPDLAAHVTVLRARGRVLLGPLIAEVFPPVPREHYLASIRSDLVWARERLAENPVYGILNACRVYCCVREGRIASKAEGGEWVLERLGKELTERERDVIGQALAVYRGKRAVIGDNLEGHDNLVQRLSELINGVEV